jgi:hypothetical protein
MPFAARYLAFVDGFHAFPRSSNLRAIVAAVVKKRRLSKTP